jgi:hypothetical protein
LSLTSANYVKTSYSQTVGGLDMRKMPIIVLWYRNSGRKIKLCDKKPMNIKSKSIKWNHDYNNPKIIKRRYLDYKLRKIYLASTLLVLSRSV